MDKELKKLDHIRAELSTYDTLANWVEEGNIDQRHPTHPIQVGVLFFDDEEYVIFEREDDVVHFGWFKSDRPYGRFNYYLEEYRVDDIGLIEKLEPTDPPDDVYKPFWYIIHAYMGSMAFITMYQEDSQAVRVQKKGSQFTYHLDHKHVELRPMDKEDSIQGQIKHFLNFGHSVNRH